jgi:hypothetical protein
MSNDYDNRDRKIKRRRVLIISILLVVLAIVPVLTVYATVYVFNYSGVSSSIQAPSVALQAGTTGYSAISPISPDAATVSATAGITFYEYQNAPTTGCVAPCITGDTILSTFGLDGSPQSGTWSSGSTVVIPNVATTDSQDVIIVWVTTFLSGSSVSVTSISDTASDVTWQSSARQSYTECTGSSETTQIEWYGTATVPLSSDTISISLSGTPTTASAAEIAITGININQPFDTASLPVVANGSCTSNAAPSVSSVSTNNANDMMLAFFGSAKSVTETEGKIDAKASTMDLAIASAGGSIAVENLAVTSVLSSTTCKFGTSTQQWGILCDAVASASGSSIVAPSSTMYLWSPQYSMQSTIYPGTGSITLYTSLSTPTLDGTSEIGTWSSGTTFTIGSVSTTNTNDIVLLSIATYKSGSSITVSSVSDSANAITWQSTARKSFTSCTGTDESTHVEWYGLANSPLSSDAITIHLSTTPTSASGIEIAISGTNTASPFDPDSVLPKTTTACSTTAAAPSVTKVSTSYSADFVLAITGSYKSTTQTSGTIGSAFATLANSVSGTGDSNAIQFVTANSPESSVTCSYGTTTTYWGILCDALVSSTTVTVSMYTTNSAGNIQSTLVNGASMTIDASGSATMSLTTSSSGVVPAMGYVDVQVTTPSSAGITVNWGDSYPTSFNTPDTYDYILAINNPSSSSYTVSLGVASSSTIGRLTNTTISFSNPSSTQITISNGAITQSVGPGATLASSSSANIEILIDSNTLPSSSNSPSTLVLSLDLIPSSSASYAQYTISLSIG